MRVLRPMTFLSQPINHILLIFVKEAGFVSCFFVVFYGAWGKFQGGLEGGGDSPSNFN